MIGDPCPICGRQWDAIDRIIMFDRTLVTPKGSTTLTPFAADIIRAIRKTPGGIPPGDLAAFWVGRTNAAHRCQDMIKALNKKLVPLGWRIMRITHKNTRESYALCEILRNDKGQLA